MTAAPKLPREIVCKAKLCAMLPDLRNCGVCSNIRGVIYLDILLAVHPDQVLARLGFSGL
jgi:hypothetical protein